MKAEFDPDETARLLNQPTISIRDAGKILGLGINKSYEAAKDGSIPTISFAGKRVVSTAMLKQVLGITPTEWPPAATATAA